MKNLSLSVVLSFISFFSFAQVPKGAYKIIVYNPNTSSENFMIVKKYLAANSILIAFQDKDVKQILTGNIGGNKVSYLIFCGDNSIIITGKYVNGGNYNSGFGAVLKDDERRVVNMGGSYKRGFREMVEFAKNFGDKIGYDVVPKKDLIKDDVY